MEILFLFLKGGEGWYENLRECAYRIRLPIFGISRSFMRIINWRGLKKIFEKIAKSTFIGFRFCKEF